MTTVNPADPFVAGLQADGFGEIETRSLPAGHSTAEHGHHFSVRAKVLEGALTLTVDGLSRRYGPGEVFTMDADRLHAEDIGADGVRYLVGRKY